MKELIAIQFLFPLNTKSQPFVLKSGNTAGYNPKSPNQHFQKYHTRPLDFGEIYKMTIFMKESIFLGFKLNNQHLIVVAADVLSNNSQWWL